MKLKSIFLLWLSTLPLLCGAEEKRRLNVGVPQDPPFSQIDNNGFVQGFYADLLDEIARRENWELSFFLDTPEQLEIGLSEKRYDIVAGLPREKSQEVSYQLVKEAVATKWGVIYTRAAPWFKQTTSLLSGNGVLPAAVQDIADLHQKTIALSARDPNTQVLRDLCRRFQAECLFQVRDSYEQALDLFYKGEAEAVLLNNIYVELHPPGNTYQATPIILNPLDIGFAVAMKDPEKIAKVLNDYLKTWKETEASYFHEASMRWLKSKAPRADTLQWHYLIWLLPLILAALPALLVRRFVPGKGKNSYDSAAHGGGDADAHYRSLVESVPYGLQELDKEGKILFSNTMDHQIRRYPAGTLIGASTVEMLSSRQQREELNTLLAHMAKEQPTPKPFYGTILRKDGELSDIRMEWQYKRDEQGEVTGFYALVTDVTETRQIKEKILSRQIDLQKAANKRAEDLKEAYNDLLMAANVFEHTTEGILVMYPDGSLQSVNPAITTMTGYGQQELEGEGLNILASRRYPKNYLDKLWELLRSKGAWRGEIWMQRKDNKLFPAWLSINVVYDAHEQVVHYVALLSDITQRKKAEQQIWRQAHFDNLTGLPNRNLFYSRLMQAVDDANKNGQKSAVMFIDLDKFKEVNDTLGHDAGDELLKAVSQRLSSCVSKKDTVARMGGDEFTVIISKLKDTETVEDIANSILHQLATPFDLSSETVNISGSIGIVICPQDGADLTTLLKNADIAMYQAKEGGRDDYRLFSSSTKSLKSFMTD